MIIFLFTVVFQRTSQDLHHKGLNQTYILGILHYLLLFLDKGVHEVYKKHE